MTGTVRKIDDEPFAREETVETSHKESEMARCELSGKRPVVKNLVSHSNIKTKTVAFPNVQKKRIFSKTLNRLVRLNMAASTIRDMEHMGGFDTYILNQKNQLLSPRAQEIKQQILRKIGAQKKTANGGQK